MSTGNAADTDAVDTVIADTEDDIIGCDKGGAVPN